MDAFTAFLIKPAAPGAKLAKNVTMTLLPNLTGQQKVAAVLKLVSNKVTVDDSDGFDLLCPPVVSAFLQYQNSRDRYILDKADNSLPAEYNACSLADGHCRAQSSPIASGVLNIGLTVNLLVYQ